MIEIITKPTYFLIDTLGSLFIGALLLRFWFQLARVDFYNPISQAIVNVTDILCAPLRALLPALGQFDLASLTMAFVVKVALIWIMLSLAGESASAVLILLGALNAVIGLLLTLLWFGIIIYAIMSWFTLGGNLPIYQLLSQILAPVIRPFQKLIPPIGGAIDLSPLFAMIAIEVMRMVTSEVFQKIALTIGGQ